MEMEAKQRGERIRKEMTEGEAKDKRGHRRSSNYKEVDKGRKLVVGKSGESKLSDETRTLYGQASSRASTKLNDSHLLHPTKSARLKHTEEDLVAEFEEDGTLLSNEYRAQLTRSCRYHLCTLREVGQEDGCKDCLCCLPKEESGSVVLQTGP